MGMNGRLWLIDEDRHLVLPGDAWPVTLWSKHSKFHLYIGFYTSEYNLLGHYILLVRCLCRFLLIGKSCVANTSCYCWFVACATLSAYSVVPVILPYVDGIFMLYASQYASRILAEPLVNSCFKQSLNCMSMVIIKLCVLNWNRRSWTGVKAIVILL